MDSEKSVATEVILIEGGEYMHPARIQKAYTKKDPKALQQALA